MAAIEKEKALDVVRQMVADGQVSQEVAEKYFPQLKESEDEKVEKAIFGMVYDSDDELWGSYDVSKSDVLDWLEEQGEHKPADKEYTFKAIPRLLGMISPTDRAKSYCQKLIDSLEQEGYSTDAKIVRGCLKQMNGEKVAMATMDEQKPTWSEEDNKNLEKTIWYVEEGGKLIFKKTDKLMSWLKSLKGRVLPQPKQEWSEEDENMLTDTEYLMRVVKMENRSDNEYQRAENCINWLKSLRPQNRWKPSEEQMDALDYYANSLCTYCDRQDDLRSLFNALKKL